MARLWISFGAIHGFFTRSRTRVGDDGLVGKGFEQIDLRRGEGRTSVRRAFNVPTISVRCLSGTIKNVREWQRQFPYLDRSPLAHRSH